jgi:hypothetical protein
MNLDYNPHFLEVPFTEYKRFMGILHDTQSMVQGLMYHAQTLGGCYQFIKQQRKSNVMRSLLFRKREVLKKRQQMRSQSGLGFGYKTVTDLRANQTIPLQSEPAPAMNIELNQSNP